MHRFLFGAACGGTAALASAVVALQHHPEYLDLDPAPLLYVLCVISICPLRGGNN